MQQVWLAELAAGELLLVRDSEVWRDGAMTGDIWQQQTDNRAKWVREIDHILLKTALPDRALTLPQPPRDRLRVPRGMALGAVLGVALWTALGIGVGVAAWWVGRG